ncbi:MAG TPA: hypothetical protein VME43_16510 [Bryobacteraceae bacterium]|nr:hypothetical protein [Bryobacteraceae bacterium]
MAESQKEALKKIAEKLKAAAEKAQKLKSDAAAADDSMDQVGKAIK